MTFFDGYKRGRETTRRREQEDLLGLQRRQQIDINKAITMVQQVADKVAFDLGLDQPITALQFLRSETEQGSDIESEEDDAPNTEQENDKN